MGRDFQNLGTEDGVKMRYGDGGGYPYIGPFVRGVFIDKNSLAIIDNERNVSLQNLTGKIVSRMYPEKNRPEVDPDFGSEYNSDDESASIKIGDYVEIFPNDLCVTSSSNNLVFADSYNFGITQVHKRAFHIDGEPIGGEGMAPLQFLKPSGIDLMKLGQEAIFFVSDSSLHCVKAITSTGKYLGQIGGIPPGMSKTQLFSPSSVAVFLDPYANNGESIYDPYIPYWYLGESDVDGIEMRLSEEYIPGHFFIGRRPNAGHIYDMVYVKGNKRHERITLEKLENGGVLKREVGFDGGTQFKSIFDVVMKSRHLVKEKDGRPSCRVAVADKENARVQIYQFFWSDSDVVQPEFRYLATIGGPRESYFELKVPTYVSYSTTGELGIVDEGRKSVFVMSPVMTLIREIKLEFTPSFQVKREILNGNKQLKLWNKTPTCVSFSPDGKIAVTYKSGGVVVHSAFKSFPLGQFEKLLQEDFERVMSYLHFQDCVALRDSCWFLHNITRRKRDLWLIYPMRHHKHHVMVYAFYKWCMLEGGPTQSLGPYTDRFGESVCMGYQEGTCTSQNACRFKHAPIYVDPFVLETSQACLARKQFCIILVAIFGAKFFWEYEIYLDELMRAYGEMKELEAREDPMTRANEVVRNVFTEKQLTIKFHGYMEIMHACEEVYHGQKGMHEHTLFSRKGKDRYRPKEEYDPDNVCLWHDQIPLEQYDDRGVDVPYKVNKTRKFKVIPGYDADVRRGAEMTPKDVHIKVYEKQADNAVQLIHRMFS